MHGNAGNARKCRECKYMGVVGTHTGIYREWGGGDSVLSAKSAPTQGIEPTQGMQGMYVYGSGGDPLRKPCRECREGRYMVVCLYP